MVATIQLHHPDYEYLFFADRDVEDFIDKVFPQYRTIFDSFPYHIQRYDFFRYLAVYHYGGFYFDLDVMLAENLNPLLETGCVFSFEGLTFSDYLRHTHNMDWEIGNYAFGAAAGHPFLGAVIANCIKAKTDPQWVATMLEGSPRLSKEEFIVLNSTGPGLISRTLAENANLSGTVAVLMPDDVGDPQNWHCFGDYGIHLMEATWRPKMSFLRRRLAGHMELRRHAKCVKESLKLGGVRFHQPTLRWNSSRGQNSDQGRKKPLVSILVPAYNAAESIADTLRSALAQTWERKEIIVVDDGSTDQTVKIARQFEACGVHVVTQKNRGAAEARNKAFSLSKGDYIQWLDADDLLAPEKISRQMNALSESSNKRIVLSSPWGHFMYRHYQARFVPTALWNDLSPTEWLFRKLDQNVYMQTASWLVSRELTEAAGPWDHRLSHDDDGEYFCRVLLASDGIQFVPDAKVYYRSPGTAFAGLSYVGTSDSKMSALWLSMQMQIRYLRSLEDSQRVKTACLNYLQRSMIYFYPERQDIVDQAAELATELGGHLTSPTLSWKYKWIKALFGWRHGKSGQQFLLRLRWSAHKHWDKLLFRLSHRNLVED